MGCFPHNPQIKQLSHKLIQQEYNLKINASPTIVNFSTSCGISADKNIATVEPFIQDDLKQIEQIDLDYLDDNLLSPKVRKMTVRQTYSINVNEEQCNNQSKLKLNQSPIIKEEANTANVKQGSKVGEQSRVQIVTDQSKIEHKNNSTLKDASFQNADLMSSNVNYQSNYVNSLVDCSRKSINFRTKKKEKENQVKQKTQDLPKIQGALQSKSSPNISLFKENKNVKNNLRFSSEKFLVQLEIGQLNFSKKKKER